LLHNQKIREVIDTITSKAVLILGRLIAAGFGEDYDVPSTVTEKTRAFVLTTLS
jgi:hypothetical protein